MDAYDVTQTAPPAAASRAAGRTPGLALLIIATAQLMLVLDDTIVNVALPTIQRSLQLPTAHLNWVASFYALAFGGLLLAGGRAGDLYGRLRMFRIGLVVFAVASMGGGLAPDATALIAARLVQGCGAALAAPGALSLLATTFPAGPARTRALGVYGAMAGLGSVVGLLLGGALTTYLSWRWVLFINVPLAIVVLAGSRTLVAGERENGWLDVPGAITATLGIGSIIYGLTSGSTSGWGAPVTLACFAAGVVLAASFVAFERTSRAPLVPIAVVRDRSRAGAYTVMLLVGAGMLAMFYLLTLYLQIVRGYSALHTGLAYLPFVVGLGIAAGGLGPRLLVKLPARGVIAAGLIIFAGGLVWYGTHLTPTSDYFVAILPGLLAGGVGGGVTFVAGTAVSVHGVAPADSGAAAGLLNTGIQVGAALGLSGLASIASIVTRSRLPGHTLPGHTLPNYTLPGHTLAAALTDGYSSGLLVGAALFAIGAVVALAAINARIEAGPVSGH